MIYDRHVLTSAVTLFSHVSLISCHAKLTCIWIRMAFSCQIIRYNDLINNKLVQQQSPCLVLVYKSLSYCLEI